VHPSSTSPRTRNTQSANSSAWQTNQFRHLLFAVTWNTLCCCEVLLHEEHSYAIGLKLINVIYTVMTKQLPHHIFKHHLSRSLKPEFVDNLLCQHRYASTMAILRITGSVKAAASRARRLSLPKANTIHSFQSWPHQVAVTHVRVHCSVHVLMLRCYARINLDVAAAARTSISSTAPRRPGVSGASTMRSVMDYAQSIITILGRNFKIKGDLFAPLKLRPYGV